jgi:predicted dehydrogenase
MTAAGPVGTTRFAVVGTGAMAATMMTAFGAASIPVTRVVSREPERGRRFASAFGVPNSASDLSAVLNSSEVDAVYVANAPRDHAATVIAALEAGKAVLCEKPIAVNLAEAKRVVDVARQTGTLCMEGLWTLFLPAFAHFIELARTRAFGEPIHLFVDFGYPEEARPNLLLPANGGVLLDRAVYLIALALNVLGPVERINARMNFTDLGVDRDAFLQLSHQGGKLSQLSASFTSLMSNSASLACSRGLIRLESPLLGSEVVSTKVSVVGEILAQDPSLIGTPNKGFVSKLREIPILRRIKQQLPEFSRRHLSYGPNQYLPELKHFVGLVRTKARESDIVPLELSLTIQEIIDKARAYS